MNTSRKPLPARQETVRASPAGAAGEDPAAVTWRLRVRMDDRPGTLARVAIRLADLGCNILAVNVLPVPGGVLDELVVRPGAGLLRDDLVTALGHEDCACLAVTDAEVRELVDAPTASLVAATRAVDAPDELADAVRDLLPADVVTVVPVDEAAPGRDESGHRAVLPVGDGRALVARRRWAPFLGQEVARAEALLALLAAVRTNLAGPAVATCDDGAALVLREGTLADTDAVALLHEHCSADTLRHRYGTEPGSVPRRMIRGLLGPPHGRSVVAVCGREIVALGQLITTRGRPAEFTLLVEDGWQCNGVGTALLRRIAALAASDGYREIRTPPAPHGAATPEVSPHAEIARVAERAGLSPAGRDQDGPLRIAL